MLYFWSGIEHGPRPEQIHAAATGCGFEPTLRRVWFGRLSEYVVVKPRAPLRA